MSHLIALWLPIWKTSTYVLPNYTSDDLDDIGFARCYTTESDISKHDSVDDKKHSRQCYYMQGMN